MFSSFDDLKKSVLNLKSKRRVAIVCPDEHSLEAAFLAKDDGLLEIALVGDKNEIERLLKKINRDDASIVHSLKEEAAANAVKLIHSKEAHFLLKGSIQTADLLKAVVDKENGLRTGRLMSHLCFVHVPKYKKLLAASDGGMCIYPTLDEKKQILQNGLDAMWKMGYKKPKVAIVTAVETPNPKMKESMDAVALKEAAQNGEFGSCIVEGPISMDLSLSKEIAKIKGYESEVVGDVDLLIFPEITACNACIKVLICLADAKLAGLILGAKVPIVLTSRGSSSEEKYLSLLLGASALEKGV